MKYKSLALKRLNEVKDTFVVCPFRSGDNPMVTMFGTFRTTCRIFQEMEERRRATHNPSVYGCFHCPLGGKVESEMKVEDIPPWVIIADDTPEKREVFEQLRENAVAQTRYACLLIAFARDSYNTRERRKELKDLVEKKEKELVERPIPEALDKERNLTDEERKEAAKAKEERKKRKRKEETRETILGYSPLKLTESQQKEVWEKYRLDGLTKANIGMQYEVSPHVIANIIKKYDLIMKEEK